jgi:hypothetical protein
MIKYIYSPEPTLGISAGVDPAPAGADPTPDPAPASTRVSPPHAPVLTTAEGKPISQLGCTPPGSGSAPATQDGPEFVSVPPNDSSRMNMWHNTSSVHYRLINDVLGGGEVLGLANLIVDDERMLLASEQDEPCSFAKAKHDPAWQAAKCGEMDSIKENGIWSLVELHHEHHPIGLK